MHRFFVLGLFVLASWNPVPAAGGEKEPQAPPTSPPVTTPTTEGAVPSIAREVPAIIEPFVAVDGTVWSREKRTENGVDIDRYRRAGVTLDAEAMRAYEQDHAAPAVDVALLEHAAQHPGATLELTLWLRERPWTPIAREVWDRERPHLESLAEDVRALNRRLRPTISLDAEEERAFVRTLGDVGTRLSSDERAFVERRGAEIEAHKAAIRDEIVTRALPLIEAQQAEVEARIAGLSGEVISRATSANIMVVSLPALALEDLAMDETIARITPVPTVTPELDNQIVSLGVDDGFWADGIDGDIWDAGVLDSGVQQNHPSLDHLAYLSTFGNTDGNGHGTAIAGMIASNHGSFRGLVPTLQTMLVGSFNGGLVQSHANWMVSTAADDPEAINLSAGYGRANDADYSSFDQFWDGLIDDNNVLVCKSTGNGGDGVTTITHPAPAYNLMAVANMNDFNNTDRSTHRITGSSSRGPTLSGRKKPDIAAPGNATTTTNNDWATGPDFISFGGTSSAAPKCTGGTLLHTELRGFDSPVASKAVMVNTADAWTDGGTTGSTTDDGPVTGSLWNPVYGWGYMDLWETWFNGNDVFTSTVDDGITPAGPDFDLYVGTLFTNEKATLAWNRHVGFNGSNLPTAVESLTDLDLLLYREPTGALIGSGHEGPNNVEQLAAPDFDTYVAKVDVFGSIDPDVGVETYALATEENWVSASAPSFGFNIAPNGVSPGRSFEIEVDVTNSGGVAAHANNATLALPPGYNFVGSNATQSIGSIAAGGGQTANWRVQAPCSEGLSFATVDNASSSYGENFTGAISPIFLPNVITLTQDNPFLNDDIERTYTFEVASFDWTVVALDGKGADHDVWGDTDLCLTSPYQSSTFGGPSRDFIVANGRSYGDSSHYALAAFGSNSAYAIETDQADDLSPGATATDTFAANEVAEIYEVAVSAGETYEVRAIVESGDIDVGLYHFASTDADGDRASATTTANRPVAGVSESLIVNATTTGLDGFVVLNDNSGSGTVRFETVRVDLFADGFESGDTGAWSDTVP